MIRNLIVFAVLLLPAYSIADPLRIFVSVPPLQTFAEKVGGNHVDVRVMVRPGHNPATYDPTPQQISALARTALYISTGVPFESSWMQRIRSANPDMRVTDARQGIEPRILESHGHAHHDHDHEHEHEHDHDHNDHDPHVWTSPPLVKHMVRNIRDALSELDPQNSHDYAHNTESFEAELDRLDRDIRTLLQDIPNPKFMVYHPAWGYFADTYGLTQVPIESGNKAPGGRTLAALIEQAKREGVKIIFVQPQFDERSAQQVAYAIGGKVVSIDPLSADYIDNIREVAKQIAAAVQQ